jgi:PAS domain S-box-containing protein
MAWFTALMNATSDGASAPPTSAGAEQRTDRAGPGGRASADRQIWLAILGLALLHLGHPLSWGFSTPGYWFPPLGVGLALVAWLGPRALLLILLQGFLLRSYTWILGTPLTWTATVGDAVLTSTEVWAAWWCARRLADGSRGFADPRSTCLFLLLVPGLCVGLFAAARSLGALGDGAAAFGSWVSATWVSHALGVLALTPPLFVAATPWLVGHGLARATACSNHPSNEMLISPPRWGDWVEIAGLALGTGVLGVLLVLTRGRGEPFGWGLWVLPLFLVIWASLRQGVRGGTIVAGAGAVVSLILASAAGAPEAGATPLQGNLLAQCSTALLVGVSSGWIAASEARYRQVVGHIPVVLYSARVEGPGGAEGTDRAVTIRFVSPASKQLLGCGPEELLGDSGHWLRRIHPEDRELLRAAQTQLERSGQPVTCEYRLADAGSTSQAVSSRGATADGRKPVTERWVRDTLVPLVAADGHLEGWEGVVADITEQRMLADDLRRTTNMFQALVTHLPAGVFFVQAPSGRPILVNARARKLLGQRENLAAGLGQWAEVYRLYRPDGTPYPAEELPVFTALRRGATSMRDDIVVHRPDGRRIPLVTWAAPIDLGGRGRPDAAVWVLEDLTTVRQAEAARLDSEARLRTVIETMAEGLIAYDRSGQVIDCNPAACAILGLNADQMRGRSLRDPNWRHLCADGTPFPNDEHPALLSLLTGEPVRNVILGIPVPEDKRQRAEGAREAAAGSSSRSVPAPSALPTSLPSALCLSPSVRWLLVSAMPLTEGRDLTPARVVTTFTDITVHRQAVAILRASEERYRGLVETLPLMLIQCDRDWRVTYVNPAVPAITGYELTDLRQPNVWQVFVHPDDLARLLTVQPEVMAGQTARLEVRFQAKNGTERVGYVIAQPRWQANEVVGITILVVDMTTQRRLEQELQRAQRLELVGRLAGGIAHDFNNLLTVVITLADMARQQLPPDHAVRDDLRRVVDAGEQASRLAGQLLAFSKHRRVTARRIDVNQVARKTLDLLRGTLPGSITVEPYLHGHDLYVQADETQLQQILMNLCLNARDAMPNGGRMRVRTDLMPGGSGRGGKFDWVRLSIHDSGHGMTETVRARIFDPFFSTKEQGTGLGLAVVQQIVESYGGRIEVWSHPGEGARFDIWLPRAADEMANLRN